MSNGAFLRHIGNWACPTVQAVDLRVVKPVPGICYTLHGSCIRVLTQLYIVYIHIYIYMVPPGPMDPGLVSLSCVFPVPFCASLM